MKGGIGQKNLKVLLKIKKMHKPVFFEGRFSRSTEGIKRLSFYEKNNESLLNNFYYS